MKKELLKRTVLAIVAVFAFAFSASAEEAKLLSFGFFQANNPGLSKDYVATIPDATAGKTTYDIEVALPAGTDLTALVAQFTVNEGNTVAVDGVAQTSGVSQNDFTDPVDYTVSNSNKSSNIRYTITVVEESAEAKAWTEVGVLNTATLSGNAEFTSVYSGAVLAINPMSNAPYVAYGARGVDNKMSVAKFEDGAWSQVGNALFSATVNGSHYDFDVAPDGTPYVAYGDQDAESLKGALSVMKFDGTKWDYVGAQGFFKVQAQYIGMAATKSGLAIDLVNNSASGAIPRRAMGIATYDGTDWTTGESSLLNAGQGVYMTKMGGNGKTATLISLNRGKVDGVNYGHNIFMYQNGQWESLATNFLETGATQTSIAPGSIGTTVAPDGTVYAWTGDDVPTTGTYQVRLKKYDTGSKTWSTVAGSTLPIGHEAGFDSHLSLNVAIAPNGTPYVAYNNFKDNKKLYVMYLDPATGQWSKSQQLADGADDVNIAFTADGKGYITYTDENSQIHLLMTEVEAPAPAQTPAITFEAPAVERTITVGLGAAGKVSVDWGDGNKVEKEAAAAYDGWDNSLEFTGTPTGTVKVYGEGITYFQAFTAPLEAAATNGITSIDLSNAATLTELDIHQNNLSTVDLSMLTALQKLTIGVNNMETIDLSANAELTSFEANCTADGKLTSLDLSKNTKLNTLKLNFNKLKSLDLTKNLALKNVYITNNELTSIDFGENTTAKIYISLNNNKLEKLDVKALTGLSNGTLFLMNNNLTELKHGAIKALNVTGNKFDLASLYETAQNVTTLTATSMQEMEIPETINGSIDLSAQAVVGEKASTIKWFTEAGTELAEGTDYTVANGVYTFIKEQAEKVYATLLNTEALPKLTTAIKTTNATVTTASGINDIKAQDGKAQIFNLAGQRVDTLKKGINIMNGKKVMVK